MGRISNTSESRRLSLTVVIIVRSKATRNMDMHMASMRRKKANGAGYWTTWLSNVPSAAVCFSSCCEFGVGVLFKASPAGALASSWCAEDMIGRSDLRRVGQFFDRPRGHRRRMEAWVYESSLISLRRYYSIGSVTNDIHISHVLGTRKGTMMNERNISSDGGKRQASADGIKTSRLALERPLWRRRLSRKYLLACGGRHASGDQMRSDWLWRKV